MTRKQLRTNEGTVPASDERRGAAVELQIGRGGLRVRSDVAFMSTVGAMVIGILLAVVAIIGAARPPR